MFEYKAYIKSVYDGDTVTAVIDCGFNIKITEKVRLFGINTPEVRGSERKNGLISRDYLRELILEKVVTIQTKKDKKGKYGRYLGTIFYEDININKLLVKKGYAEFKDY